VTAPPGLALRWLAKDIGTIDGFLSAMECDAFINFSESRRYEEAPVTTERGMIVMKELRNNDRVMVDDVEMAASLYGKLAAFAPPRVKKKWAPVGLNERLRFYRYDVGQQFDWHLDGYFERDGGERSFFTFMIYLNDDFEGGGTSFRDDGFGANSFGALRVTPKKGMALLFHHPIPHRGDPVTVGRKYILRTDIMYARRGSSPSRADVAAEQNS
jgi:predicted 2-oxoglutarate/Fe(II)-dependent dioxygenase YbiX